MRARDIVGKRIVKVDQSYLPPRPGARPVWTLDRIHLDDGTVLYPHTIETEVGEYWTELVVNTTGKRGRIKKG